jgi:hypothetical protein
LNRSLNKNLETKRLTPEFDKTAAGGDYKSVRRQGRKTSKAAELGKIKTSDTHKQLSTPEFDKTVAGVSGVSDVVGGGARECMQYQR